MDIQGLVEAEEVSGRIAAAVLDDRKAYHAVHFEPFGADFTIQFTMQESFSSSGRKPVVDAARVVELAATHYRCTTECVEPKVPQRVRDALVESLQDSLQAAAGDKWSRQSSRADTVKMGREKSRAAHKASQKASQTRFLTSKK